MADEKRIITVNQGTKLEWQNQARTQKTGELGLATDSRELKIGDGLKSFFDLPTLLEVDNAETIKAALEGNATLTGSNVVADMAALEDGLATKQDEIAANILAALEGNTSLSGTNVVADKGMLDPLAVYNIYVNASTGNDSTGNGSPEAPYKTLAHAVSKTPQFGTITINIAGTFELTEQITINRPLATRFIIAGGGVANTKITNKAGSSLAQLINASETDFYVSGITLEANETDAVNTAIFASSRNHMFRASNLVMNNFAQYALYVSPGGAVLNNCNFNDNGIAIYVNAYTGLMMWSCDFYGNAVRFKVESGIIFSNTPSGTDTVDQTGYGGQIFIGGRVVQTPAAGTWVGFTGTYTLPAGGTWAYARFASFTAAPTVGVAAGGTAIGAASTSGFAWKIAA
jgi:hypothetical protein